MTLLLEDGITTLFSHSGDSIEVHVTHNDDSFTVIWGDYVANAWEEHYDKLAPALARCAVLIGGSEFDAGNFGFLQSDAIEFTAAWEDAMATFIADYESPEEPESEF